MLIIARWCFSCICSSIVEDKLWRIDVESSASTVLPSTNWQFCHCIDQDAWNKALWGWTIWMWVVQIQMWRKRSQKLNLMLEDSDAWRFRCLGILINTLVTLKPWRKRIMDLWSFGAMARLTCIGCEVCFSSNALQWGGCCWMSQLSVAEENCNCPCWSLPGFITPPAVVWKSKHMNNMLCLLCKLLPLFRAMSNFSILMSACVLMIMLNYHDLQTAGSSQQMWWQSFPLKDEVAWKS